MLSKAFSLIFISLLIFSAAGCSKKDSSPTQAENTTGQLEGWTLMFQDEFDQGPVDTQKWIVSDGAWSYNDERQYYAPDEVYVENGYLRIRSERRNIKDKSYASGHLYTRFSQLYGRFEIKAREPKTKGLWPAIWLLPADGSWPPEIDILELLGHDPYTVYMTNHWGTQSDHKSNGGSCKTADYSKDFHIFAIEWSKGEIKWFVDGVEKFRSTSGVPDKAMYLILNTAVGGFWPGYPDNTTVFPQYHDIEYVRIYKKN